MEERKAKGEGMINKLPDSLLTQMLLYLPTKEAVRTSVLSKRWKKVWLFTPKLDLDSLEFRDYNAFVSFVDKFIDFSREDKSCLQKFKLSILKDENDKSCVTPWIEFVATPKLKYLDVEFGPLKPKSLEVMPLCLYVCDTLLFLRLHRVMLGKFESVSLPCLKIMCLEHIIYESEESLELLISSCPVLEDLKIVRRVYNNNVKFLRVRSKTLTNLNIQLDEAYESEVEGRIDEYEYDEPLRLLVDAPRLKYLNLEDDVSEILINCGSLTKVNFIGNIYQSDTVNEVDVSYMMCKLFTCLSGVRDMKIAQQPYEVFEMYMVQYSHKFCNLSCLEVEMSFAALKTLPKCPNLKSLILDLLACSTMQTKFSFVPQCLLSSLEFVEVIKSVFWGTPIMELGRYFLENSVILKKLLLRMKFGMLDENSVVVRNLLALPKLSSQCQIVFGDR